MALAKKCDRCGKLYEHYPIGDQAGVFNSIKRVRKNDEGHVRSYEERSIDLCPECMDTLNRFLKGEAEDNSLVQAVDTWTRMDEHIQRMGKYTQHMKEKEKNEMKDILELVVKIEELLMKSKFEWFIAYDPKNKAWNIQIKRNDI